MTDKYDPFRKIARETIDPDAKRAITDLIKIARDAEDETDRLRDRIAQLRDRMADM